MEEKILKSENLEEVLQYLEKSKDHHVLIAKEIRFTGKTHGVDFFLLAMIQRSLSIIRGFCTETRDGNFLAAAPLVRIHLDTVLNTYAAFISGDPEKFWSRKLTGEWTRNIVDKNGKKMTDTYLADKLSKDKRFPCPWAKEVYEKSSGFVHTTNVHLLGIFRDIRKTKGIVVDIFEKLDGPLKSKLDAAKIMIYITEALFMLCRKWVITKKTLKKA
jgi:hypothetical protein